MDWSKAGTSASEEEEAETSSVVDVWGTDSGAATTTGVSVAAGSVVALAFFVLGAFAATGVDEDSVEAETSGTGVDEVDAGVVVSVEEVFVVVFVFAILYTI